MIIEGQKITEDVYTAIQNDIATLGRSPILSIITCEPNFETKAYLALKEKKAKKVGVTVNVCEMPTGSTTEAFIAAIESARTTADGILVQLPLPAYVDREKIVTAIPSSHDVDVLNPATTLLLSPVVGAFKIIIDMYAIPVTERFVTIIGNGKLVGLPAYHWFIAQGAHVSVVTKDVVDLSDYTRNADIIVCGAGAPGLVRPEMIKEGVVILDAGTSEDAGELRGDADPSCAAKASIFTPVPGGVGPLTVAILLQNVLECAKAHDSVV